MATDRRKTRRERLTLWLLDRMDIDTVAEWLLGKFDVIDSGILAKIKADLRAKFDARRKHYLAKTFTDQAGIVVDVWVHNSRNGNYVAPIPRTKPEHEQAKSGDEPEGGE